MPLLIDQVEIIEESGEYYLKPENIDQQSWTIPRKVFLAYVKVRGGKERIPKRILKRFHVLPDEIHKFNDDGSVTIKTNY